jgi:hypothetical protein
LSGRQRREKKKEKEKEKGKGKGKEKDRKELRSVPFRSAGNPSVRRELPQWSI